MGKIWSDVYQNVVDDKIYDIWVLLMGQFFSYIMYGLEQQVVDLNGDGLFDIILGSVLGGFEVQFAQFDFDGNVVDLFIMEIWDNLLFCDVNFVEFQVIEIDVIKDIFDLDCWYNFDYDVQWDFVSVGLLGYM